MAETMTLKQPEITQRDISAGFKFDYPLDWRDIIRPMGLMDPQIAEQLDTLQGLIPNDCDVTVKPSGKVSIDNWPEGRRRDEIFSWLEHCKKQELINDDEFATIWREVCRIR